MGFLLSLIKNLRKDSKGSSITVYLEIQAIKSPQVQEGDGGGENAMSLELSWHGGKLHSRSDRQLDR